MYKRQYQDCAGTYFGGLVEDCSGECGGTLTLDYCGVCGGDNVENDCHEAPVCGDDEFDCLGDGTECIPASWECDIYWADCSNGADEANCGGDDSAGDCVNDDSTGDAYGDTCSGWYDMYEYPGSSGCMGAYDTADFSAAEQCCACQDSRTFETADSSDFDSEYVFEKMTQGKETYFENYEIAAERHFAYSVDNGRDDCGGTGPDVDECGVCFGDDTSCADECGVPNGDGSSYETFDVIDICLLYTSDAADEE